MPTETTPADAAPDARRRPPESWVFFSSFLRNPRGVAAVLPSSRRLARMMADELTYRPDQSIVEIGAGTGVFTRELASRLRDGARLLSIEREGAFVDFLRDKAPGADVHHGDAADLAAIMRGRGMHAADYVVSGIGWPSIPREPRERMLTAIRDALVPGGKFLTFGYHVGWCLPSTWAFWAFMKRTFHRVSVSPVIWANVPPAYIYRCER